MQNIDFGKLVLPKIRIRIYDHNGVEVDSQIGKNKLTYSALDVFMNAWLQSGPSQVTHLYVRFGDSGANPGFLSPTGGDLRATNRGDFIASNDSIRGGMWVPILSAPTQSTSDPARYIGNKATFFFRIPSNISQDQMSPVGNFNPATSYIYSMGLAVAFNTGDRQFDKIVSTMQAYGFDADPDLGDFEKFKVPPGGQISLDYNVPIVFGSEESEEVIVT